MPTTVPLQAVDSVVASKKPMLSVTSILILRGRGLGWLTRPSGTRIIGLCCQLSEWRLAICFFFFIDVYILQSAYALRNGGHCHLNFIEEQQKHRRKVTCLSNVAHNWKSRASEPICLLLHHNSETRPLPGRPHLLISGVNEWGFFSGFQHRSLEYRRFQADGALRFEALL